MLTEGAAPPLILTATMDEAAQRFFNRQRQEFFPPDRNVLDAHITLFHKLPPEHLVDIHARLSSLSVGNAIMADVKGLRFLGRGVAYDIESPALAKLRNDLADRWRDWLGPQDRNAFKPHITVQNKVEPDVARNLFDTLSVGFREHKIEITGLGLWRYMNGPWSSVQSYRFNDEF